MKRSGKAMAAAIAALVVAATILMGACGGSDEKETIVFSELSWDSAEVQTRIAMFIVEHGYGYPADAIAGDTIPLFQGLINNDTHVTLEIWLPNQREAWEKALEEGTVVDLGESLEDNWQGFVIPQYVKDANPGLVSVTDLPDHADLFATPDSRGKARFITCVAGWACELVNAEKIATYGLEDHLDVVNPGNGAALFADLEASYARGDAWLGYMWGPTRPSRMLDLYVLEEPPYSDECWESGKGCAYPIATIKIAVNVSLLDRAPDVVEFLRKWEFETGALIDTTTWMTDNNETAPSAALYYLRKYRDLWSAFVPADVAERVDEALAAEG